YSYENWLKSNRTSVENCKKANNTRLRSSGDLKYATVRNGRQLEGKWMNPKARGPANQRI
ncbi:MAG: hypothetical protein OSB45_15525, partial [Pseudomonadales bacterium]|nr:hypothetical protein [Pseudomonadales bacterium]